MGRHAAPVSFDSPSTSAEHDSAHPITDPMLLVRPADAPPAAGMRSPAPRSAQVPRPKPAPRTPGLEASTLAANPVVAEHLQARHPRPLAPTPAPLPLPLRSTSAYRAQPVFNDTPIAMTPRFAPASLSTVVLPIQATTAALPKIDAEEDAPPRAFEKRRTVALAACAIAVLGAVSTAAAILPSNHADASPRGLCVAGPTQPRPTMHPSKHSIKQWRAAKRAARAAAAAAALAGTGAGTPSSSSTPSSSATPSTSASATPSSTPSGSASPTGPASTTPPPTSSDPVTEVVGSLSALISKLAGGVSASLASGVYTFNGFSASNAGVQLSNGITGAGESKTVLKIVPHSSNKAGSVPTASGTTNPLYLMKINGGSPVFKDFTLQGTAQGHLYNGIVLKGTTGARFTNVRVNAIPGNDRVNPGETFGINDFRTSGSVYQGVEIDGQGVGASALAFNSSSNPRISDSYFHDNPYSAGIALWQTHDATITDVISTNNRTGINLERVSGTVNVVRPTLAHNSAQDFYIGSDQGSVKLNIVDPKVSGKIRIRIPTNYWAGSQQQKRSDVHVIVNGVDRTNEMVQWL